MDEYVAGGRKLQYEVIQSEAEQLARGTTYTAEEVAQATVHARQDMVLLVWNLRAIRQQLRWLVRLAVAGLVVVLYAVWRR